MLTLNKQQLQPKETIKITNKNAVFKDTEYANSEFTFIMKPIGRKDSVNILTRSGIEENGEYSIDNGEVSKRSFVASVVDWSGLKYDDDTEIPCNNDTKSAIWEAFPTLTDALQTALNEHIKKLNKVKATVKKKS